MSTVNHNDHNEPEEEHLSGKAFDSSKWTKKEFTFFLVFGLLATYLFSLDYNLNYMIVNIPLNQFNSASLAAIAPTISSILTILLVPFFAKFSDVIGRAQVLTFVLFFK
ncbi:hypothetical protein BGW38_006622, partial [Lunasporangiospora selenospora]